jgi:hypothetical protein
MMDLAKNRMNSEADVPLPPLILRAESRFIYLFAQPF